MTVLFSYKLAQRYTQDKSYALYAGMILATSFYIIFAGRNGQWDIFTHAFMMGSIYFLFKFFTTDEKKWGNALVAAVFFGASFMSKGPVSLYALWLPFMLAFGIVYRFKGMKTRWFPILVFVGISLLLSGWWHWYVYTYDAETIAAITKKEASNWTGYNVRPFYYYWSFFTQSGVWTIPAFIGLLYPYLKHRVSDKQGYRFTFWWTVLSVLLLSIIPEKKSRYLLPVLIPLALNTAFYIEYLIRRFSEITDRRETIPVYFHFGLIAFIGLFFPIGGYLFLGDSLTGYWGWFVVLSLSLFGIGLFIFRSLFKKSMKKVFYGNVIFIIAIMCFGLPMAKALTGNPEYNGLSNLHQWEDKTHLPVYEYGGFTPELIWDYGAPIPVISDDNEFDYPTEIRFGVLVSEDQMGRFNRQFKDYDTKKIDRYDMNPQAPGHSTHRPRLWRDLYLVELKSDQ